jgi:hypothetical protein
VVKPKESTPKVFLEDEYEVRTCKTNNINFGVMNSGDMADTFTISYSGAAADWIDSDSSVYLNAGERKTVTAYVSVPCYTSDVQHFTVKVANTQTASATSFFKILGVSYTGWFFNWDGGYYDVIVWILIFLLFVGILLILVLFFMWALSGRTNNRRSGRESPEGFRYFESSHSRKNPECFT